MVVFSYKISINIKLVNTELLFLERKYMDIYNTYIFKS